MTRAAQPSPGKTTLLIVAGRKISVSRPSFPRNPFLPGSEPLLRLS